MKELSIEEKAKAYDKALKMAKECITYIPDEAVNKYMLSMFPELKEPEDEKIRKATIKMIKEDSSVYEQDLTPHEMIVWLERQGKQQKSSWSEEDEKITNAIINVIQAEHPKAMWTIEFGNTVSVSTKYIIDWLNSLNTRIKS